MKLLERLYAQLLLVLPQPILLGVKSLGLARLFERWNPRRDPDFAWPLKGRLAHHRMRFRCMEDFQFLNESYEPDVCAAIERLVSTGEVCVDGGAHLGYMTLLLAKLVGSTGRIFSFEAVPDNARCLEGNVTLNSYADRVIVENKAISDGSEPTLTLYAGPSTFEATIVNKGWATMTKVPAVALDSYFPPGQRVDFVKMDIEGGETTAVPGMRRLLRESRPVVLIEIHDVGWPAVEALVEAGYRLYDLHLQPVDLNSNRGCLNHAVAVPVERAELQPMRFR